MKQISLLVFIAFISIESVFAQYQHQQQTQYDQHGQRVAPGVPPQHYEQPQAVNQNQQQQQQYQQQQYQAQAQQQQQYQQQPPPANVQYQQQPNAGQQPPAPVVSSVGSGHVHHRPQGQVFDTSNIAMEREHLQEHMELPIDTSKMTQDELLFHNFKMWDGDKDDIVDGLDLMKYLMGHIGPDESTGASYTEEQFIDIVDQIMKSMDVNNDGMTTFPEYMQSSKGTQG